MSVLLHFAVQNFDPHPEPLLRVHDSLQVCRVCNKKAAELWLWSYREKERELYKNVRWMLCGYTRVPSPSANALSNRAKGKWRSRPGAESTAMLICVFCIRIYFRSSFLYKNRACVNLSAGVTLFMLVLYFSFTRVFFVLTFLASSERHFRIL